MICQYRAPCSLYHCQVWLLTESLLEPSGSVLLLHTVGSSNSRSLLLPSGNSSTRSGHDDKEVGTEDTNSRVVLDSQVNVLCDTETKVASLGEVPSSQLVLLDLESSLEDLLCLGSSDSDVASNLFVTSDTEASESVSSLGSDWRLTSELFQYLGSSGESVSRFTNGDVDDELVNSQLLWE